MMRDSTFAIFLEQTKPLEGCTTWMYPDRLNLVTTGLGNLIDPVGDALGLPWIHMGSGALASRTEILAAWQNVKASGLGKLGGFAPQIMALTDLRLLESDVDALVRAKCQANETALAAHFANWDALPDRAQAATLMLAWACGYAAITEPHGGLHRFPRFEAALQAGQLAVTQDDERGRPVLVGGCAFECVMPASANPGNDLTARNAATQALFVAAALEVAGKL
jgi:hypothetical protein